MLDPDSAEWLRSLERHRSERNAAQVQLHGLLLRIARSEVHRRSEHLRIGGPELDDMAHQAAADALVAIIAKIDQFRGDSRFTTWAYKFVMFEVSTKIGRHFWRNPSRAHRRRGLGAAARSVRPRARPGVRVARSGGGPSPGGGQGADRSANVESSSRSS